MHAILASSAIVLLASLAACGGSSSDAPTTDRTAQSQALTTPGSVDISTDGSTVTLAGGNTTGAPCSGGQFGFTTGPCTVSATLPAFGRKVSFEWSYATTDNAGPGADVFAMIVDGRVVPISDPGGAQKQSGQIEVVANSSLQLFMNCTDCTDGAATAKVTALTR